jgi:hypothetical protein
MGQTMELLDGCGGIGSSCEKNLSNALRRQRVRSAEEKRSADQWIAITIVLHLDLLHLPDAGTELSDVVDGDVQIQIADRDLCSAHSSHGTAWTGSNWCRGS